MKCAYCGMTELARSGVKHPEYVVQIVKEDKTYYFCSLQCLRSWVVRLVDPGYHQLLKELK